MVPATGLEPVRCYSLEPESSASANSATRALNHPALFNTGGFFPGQVKINVALTSGGGGKRPALFPDYCSRIRSVYSWELALSDLGVGMALYWKSNLK